MEPCSKCVLKAGPRTLYNFGKLSKTAIACKKSYKNKIFLKRLIKKP